MFRGQARNCTLTTLVYSLSYLAITATELIFANGISAPALSKPHDENHFHHRLKIKRDGEVHSLEAHRVAWTSASLPLMSSSSVLLCYGRQAGPMCPHVATRLVLDRVELPALSPSFVTSLMPLSLTPSS